MTRTLPGDTLPAFLLGRRALIRGVILFRRFVAVCVCVCAWGSSRALVSCRIHGDVHLCPDLEAGQNDNKNLRSPFDMPNKVLRLESDDSYLFNAAPDRFHCFLNTTPDRLFKM